MIAGNPPRGRSVGRYVRSGALAVSTVVHGAALVLIVRALRSLPEPPPPPPAPATASPTVAAADPIEVTLLAGDVLYSFNPPATRPASGAATRATHSARGPGAAARVERVEGVPGQGSETTGNGARDNGKTSPLRMRGPDLGLAPGVAERIAAGGAPAPAKAVESGRLENAPGGGAVIHDRVTTVTVERDGTAHFNDKPDIDAHWQVPIPHLDVQQDLHELGDALQEWYADPYKLTRYGTTSELSEIAKAVPGNCDGWGDPMCDDPLAPDAEQRQKRRANNTVGVGGGADISAWLMRKYGHFDPYASRKRKLLDDTRAEREERGAEFRAEQAAHSAELMQRTLEELWARVVDPAARKQALYELWSDCADDEAGQRARAMVLGWIRSKLPAGSPAAFTADELARLAPFRPYD